MYIRHIDVIAAKASVYPSPVERMFPSLKATKPAERPAGDLVPVLLLSCVTIDWESARQGPSHRCGFGFCVFDHIPKNNLEVRPNSRPWLAGQGWFSVSVSLSVAAAVIQAVLQYVFRLLIEICNP